MLAVAPAKAEAGLSRLSKSAIHAPCDLRANGSCGLASPQPGPRSPVVTVSPSQTSTHRRAIALMRCYPASHRSPPTSCWSARWEPWAPATSGWFPAPASSSDWHHRPDRLPPGVRTRAPLAQPAQVDPLERGVLGGIGVYLTYLTVVKLGAGRATFISNTYVVWGALLAAWLLKEALHPSLFVARGLAAVDRAPACFHQHVFPPAASGSLRPARRAGLVDLGLRCRDHPTAAPRGTHLDDLRRPMRLRPADLCAVPHGPA